MRGIGLAFLAAGLILGFIGMAGSALTILQPNPIASVINTGEHAGLVFIAAGMMAWGALAIRTLALGRWSLLPFAMGFLSMTGIVFVIPSAFAAVEASVVPLAFAASWMLLGLALLRTRPAASEGPGRPVLH